MMIDHNARAEDLRWLVDTGENLTGAARRLGTTRDALEKWARLHGMVAEFHKLKSREPADPFRSERARVAAAARWSA